MARGVIAALGLALAATVCATAAAGEEEAAEYGTTLQPQRIIVTATRIPTPVEDVPASVTVFPAAPVLAKPLDSAAISGYSGTHGFTSRLLERGGVMEARQYRDVADALRVTPGVDIQSQGGMGTLTGMRIRGMDSYHTLMLVDGMPMADPSQPDRALDLSGFSLDNIGQLEVMRGPQSVLYGSSAFGGVVSLSSARGVGPFSGSVTTEAGSYGTVMSRLKAQAGNEKGDFSFGGGYVHTDGISAASRWRGNSERDSYDRGSANLRLGYNVGDTLRLDLFANGASYLSEYDAAGAFNVPVDDAPEYAMRVRGKRFMIRPQATLALFDGRWEQKAGFGVFAHDRQYKNRPEAAGRRDRYYGETTKFDYQSIVRTHENNAIVAGVDVVSEKMKTWQTGYGPGETPANKYGTNTMTSVYAEDQFNWRETLFLNGGLRYDHHDQFGDKVTWKAGALYALPTNTRLKASAGTGFNAPALDALYNDTYNIPYPWMKPNPDLKPETSFGWDVGFEQSFFEERLAFGSTFFWNKVKNKVVMGDDGTGIWTYANANRYRSEGIESFLRFILCDSVQVNLQHTWMTGNQDLGTHVSLDRRPKHIASLNVDWLVGEKGTLTAGVRYTGTRRDGNHRMPSHTMARIAASWRFNDRLEAFGRVENLFNKKYEEVYGYGTMGTSFFGGVTLSF